MNSVLVLKTEITSTTVEFISDYLKNEKSKTVAICNANTLVRSYRNSNIQEKINSFDIKAPDGFPVAKASKFLYKNNQKRVDGYKVFHETIKNGINSNLSHYFFGSNEKIVFTMIKKLKEEYPEINISGYKCPPVKTYKELCEGEFVENMIKQNADVIWVSLGFPKQEEFILMLKNNI